MGLQQRRQSFEQPCTALAEPARKALPLAERQLRAQPTLTEEFRPVRTPGIRLWRATDGVVAPPAEARRRHRMQRSEPLAEAALARRSARALLDPFERKKSCRARQPDREHRRHTQCARRTQLAKAVDLGRECGVRGAG